MKNYAITLKTAGFFAVDNRACNAGTRIGRAGVSLTRFFQTSQFKRSRIPSTPKVGWRLAIASRRPACTAGCGSESSVG